MSQDNYRQPKKQPKRQAHHLAPSWWCSQSGLHRLEDETARLERIGQIETNDPMDDTTWLIEVLPFGYKDKLKIRFECAGSYDLNDNPFVTALYKGVEFPVLSPILATWDQASRLDQVVEEIKKQVNQRKRLSVIIGAVAGIVLLVFGLVIMVALLNSQKAASSSNLTATANVAEATAAALEANSKAMATAGQVALDRTAVAVANAPKSESTRSNLPVGGSTPHAMTERLSRPILYPIKSGDSIPQLAVTYNTSVQVIVEANRNAATLGLGDKALIVNPDSANPLIYVGYKLVIQVGRQEFKGYAIIWSEVNSQPDELQKLLDYSGLTLLKLLDYNGVTSVADLKIGDPLLIPKK
ncbi:MAG: LysM domain-containing protein [Chloroflexota bacterium]